MKVDPNAPAYPSNPSADIYCNLGIPIRLAIAAQIMAGLASNSCLSETWSQEGRTIGEMASVAHAWADALIAAHNEGAE